MRFFQFRRCDDAVKLNVPIASIMFCTGEGNTGGVEFWDKGVEADSHDTLGEVKWNTYCIVCGILLAQGTCQGRHNQIQEK
jgi:hypothetical protein